mmetsp:Transcript_17586/g.55407  ORF Transcript_17586/g.55407 Transcript_17586/m.55407 type:complete len:357 (-) Transcript_17586:392-1462(-)
MARYGTGREDHSEGLSEECQFEGFGAGLLGNAWRQMSEPAKVVENTLQADKSDGLPGADWYDDFSTYQPGSFLRQTSEPASLSTAPTSPPGLPPGVRVKNTFLDFCTNYELDKLRWQSSKPVKVLLEKPGQAWRPIQKPNGAAEPGGQGHEADASTSVSETSSHRSFTEPTTPEPGMEVSEVSTPKLALPHLDPPLRAEVPVCKPKPVRRQEPRVAGQSAYTVTVQGLPWHCTTPVLKKELFDAGYKEGKDYDFLFMPRDLTKTGWCIGCAFINLTSTSTMRSFIAAFNGRALRYIAANQVLAVRASTLQDLPYVSGQQQHVPSAPATRRFCTSCGCQFGHSDFNFCPGCGAPVLK